MSTNNSNKVNIVSTFVNSIRKGKKDTTVGYSSFIEIEGQVYQFGYVLLKYYNDVIANNKLTARHTFYDIISKYKVSDDFNIIKASAIDITKTQLVIERHISILAESVELSKLETVKVTSSIAINFGHISCSVPEIVN